MVASGWKVCTASASPPTLTLVSLLLTKGTCKCASMSETICLLRPVLACTAYFIPWAGKRRRQQDERKRTKTKSPTCQRAGGRASDDYAKRGTVYTTIETADFVCYACISGNGLCFRSATPVQEPVSRQFKSLVVTIDSPWNGALHTTEHDYFVKQVRSIILAPEGVTHFATTVRIVRMFRFAA